MHLSKFNKPNDTEVRVGASSEFAWDFAIMFWSVPEWEYKKIYCAMQRG
jgi:hypothetical protein